MVRKIALKICCVSTTLRHWVNFIKVSQKLLIKRKGFQWRGVTWRQRSTKRMFVPQDLNADCVLVRPLWVYIGSKMTCAAPSLRRIIKRYSYQNMGQIYSPLFISRDAILVKRFNTIPLPYLQIYRQVNYTLYKLNKS